MSDIFISYSREDQNRAEALVRALESQGWSVWWDRSLGAGDDFDQIIDAELEAARCVVVMWSKSSVDKTRTYVRGEARYAAEQGILVPVAIDKGVRPPRSFRHLQTADLSTWKGKATDGAFSELAEDIGRVLGSKPSPVPPPRRHRIPGLLAIGLGAAALVLPMWSVPEARISGNVEASQLQFRTAASRPLGEQAELRVLSASTAANVRLVGAPGTPPVIAAGEVPLSLTLVPAEDGGRLRLEGLEVPAGGGVDIGRGPSEGDYSFVFLSCASECDRPRVRIRVEGGANLSYSGSGSVPIPDLAAVIIDLDPERSRLTLGFSERELRFARSLPASEIAFEVFEMRGTSTPLDAVASSVLSGDIRFQDPPRRTHELRAGEHLGLVVEEAEIESLDTDGGSLRVAFGALVGGVETDQEGGGDLMPSRMRRIAGGDWPVESTSVAVGTVLLLAGAVSLILDRARRFRSDAQSRA